VIVAVQGVPVKNVEEFLEELARINLIRGVNLEVIDTDGDLRAVPVYLMRE